LKVLACYVSKSLKRETYRALVDYVPIGSLEMVEVSHDVSAYWHEIRKRWNGEDDLLIVEQDNVITAETIPSFNMCDKPWCTYWYPGPPGMVDNKLTKSLGCTRFSAELQKAVPYPAITDKEYFIWHMIDARVADALELRGYAPHVHGEVKHLHTYDMTDEEIAQDRAMRVAASEFGWIGSPYVHNDPSRPQSSSGD
jgi:hypothetical protein